MPMEEEESIPLLSPTLRQFVCDTLNDRYHPEQTSMLAKIFPLFTDICDSEIRKQLIFDRFSVIEKYIR